MRNLKKFLALVLAMMMVFSLMVTVNASTFADEGKISDTYSEAAEVLNGMKVFTGYEDGTFGPDKPIKRSEVAAVLYRVLTGDTDPNSKKAEIYKGYGGFGDVKYDDWFAGYVGFVSNGGKVVGYPDKTFKPNKEVTGYEVLAMLLRAIGYGKNGEFEGSKWDFNTSYQARYLGITKNISESMLRLPATREMVAEMVYQAIQIPQVIYTPLGEYSKTSNALGVGEFNPTLGEEFFGLKMVDTVDEWGRPEKVWYNKDLGVKKGFYTAILYPLVADFDVAKDECDVVDEFGLENDDVIEYWIDGVKKEVSDTKDKNYATVANRKANDGHNDIQDLHVGYTIGGQGVQTEIYEVEGGYHVVQINTWLAQVTDVTLAKEDKNQHKGNDVIDFVVFDCLTHRGANEGVDGTCVPGNTGHRSLVKNYTVTASYTKGQYILVNSCAGKYRVVGAAPVVLSGEPTDYADADYPDPATHTFDKKNVEKDAEKFYLNWRVIDGKSYVAYGDGMGNVIGVAENPVPNNYAVVTAIVWNHNGLKGGYASATLILDDGTVTDEVIISKIDNKAPVNSDAVVSAYGDIGKVADHVNNNTIYLKHLFTYVENEDGSYNLGVTDTHTGAIPEAAAAEPVIDVGQFPTAGNAHTGKYGVIYKGEANIWEWDDSKGSSAGKIEAATELTRKARGTDETVYAIWNAVDKKYDIYEGKDKVPDTIGDMCIANDANGYATFVVVNNVLGGSRSDVFLAYIADTTVPTTGGKSIDVGTPGSPSIKAHTGFKVYPIGTWNAKTIYIETSSDVATVWTAAVEETGIYEITIDENNNIASKIELVIGDDAAVAYASAKTPNVITDYDFTNVMAKAVVVGRTLYTGTYTNKFGDIPTSVPTYGSDDQNYDLDAPETAYVVVTKQADASGNYPKTGSEILTKGTVGDIDKNSVVIVGYENIGNKNFASYVYIIKTEKVIEDDPDTTTSYKFNTATATYASNKISVAAKLEKVSGDNFTAKEVKVTFKATLQRLNKLTEQYVDVVDCTTEEKDVESKAAATVDATANALDISAQLSGDYQYQVVITAIIDGEVVATRTIQVSA